MLSRARPFFDVQGVGARAPWRIFWVGFLVRLLYMTLAHTYRIRNFEEHFNFAWEAGRIGKALASGYGYSDPFANSRFPHTGPTAWLPPLYPLLVAGVFRICGIYTAASAWVLLALNCLFSAATSMAVWEIGARCFNRRVALWSGWIWVLHPAAMQYAVRWIWETSLTTALFAWAIVLALRMRSISADDIGAEHNPWPSGQMARWSLAGLIWGLIALSNSSLLLLLPIYGLWILQGSWARSKAAGAQAPSRLKALEGATIALVLFAACVAPWTWRNWQTFHAVIPLRGNFGAELYMGNGPGSTGLLMTYDHPHVAPDQLRLYAALGEVRYTAIRGALAREYIKAHPAHFAGIVARRIYFFWAGVPSDVRWLTETLRLINFSFASLAGLLGLGLALHRRVPAAGLFAAAFLLLPLTYYLVTVHARFRHPLEPLLCILGVYLFQSSTSGKRSAARSPEPRTSQRIL